MERPVIGIRALVLAISYNIRIVIGDVYIGVYDRIGVMYKTIIYNIQFLWYEKKKKRESRRIKREIRIIIITGSNTRSL